MAEGNSPATDQENVGSFSGFLATSFFLLSLACFSKALGPFSPSSYSMAGVALLALFALHLVSPFKAGTLFRHAVFFAVLGAAVLLVFWLDEHGHVSALFLAGAALCLLHLLQPVGANSGPARVLLMALILTTFLFAVFTLAYLHVPLVWLAAQQFSQIVTSSVANLFGQKHVFGATAFGLSILFFFVIFVLAIEILSESRDGPHSRIKIRRLPAFLVILALLVSHIAFVLLHQPVLRFLEAHTGEFHAHAAPLSPTHLLIAPFLLDLIPTWAYLRTRRLPPQSPSFQKIRWGFAGLAALAFLIPAALLSWPDSPLPREANRRIYILNRGYFNWEKPEFGSYGLQSSGMLGMLPDYLRALDYEVAVDSIITTARLDSVQVLLVINLDRLIDSTEKKIVVDFVQRGGALFVLGDHTGLGEIMPPLNDLLTFAGIQFNFDSAHYLEEGWDHAFELRPHAINADIENEDDVGISIGASLALNSLKSRPIITARYGFSDIGDWTNRQNAYLGDRRYNPGELLGDIVLIAESKYGKGKILVFGDTSSLQNGAMARNSAFVDQMLKWLTAPSGTDLSGLRLVGGALLALMTIGLLFGFSHFRNDPIVLIAAFLGLTLGLAASSAHSARQCHSGGILLSNEKMPRSKGSPDAEKAPDSFGVTNERIATQDNPAAVYLDMSHLERYEIYGESGIWSLLYTLMRSDCLPFVHTHFSSSALSENRAFIEIAPARSWTRDELDSLDTYLREGGLVIWSVGYEEKEASEGFLRRYNLDIDNVPLGSIAQDQNDCGLHFHKAWPIIVSDSTDLDVMCRAWDYPIIICRKVGNGRLVLIADSEFLLARNLEGASKVHESNLRFIHSLVNPLEEKTTQYADFANRADWAE